MKAYNLLPCEAGKMPYSLLPEAPIRAKAEGAEYQHVKAKLLPTIVIDKVKADERMINHGQ
ncbi:hypothetical protein [Desulfomicrobium baculatum]|uniref:Uncharacterized protein n=1 Tax=Desulfomicrobium baculatum (strain DSM 4028 / VKM B-1378 / X) TaxID=525897 RepID=C7LRE1_DESBD|nr:hypothetical protein [Desulfomicrobium baculatum]ACU89287.1 hypothetical protein Dbac_1183 [Desulfomicrobium baculatum DSM 4028]